MTIRPPTDEMARRFEAALDFAGRFFMGTSPIQIALSRIAALLDRDKIPYALAGAMAMNLHGYERVTTDLDLLMTKEGLAEFKKRHIGLGYLDRFPGSKAFRDTENGVPIDVLITGDYPGDGKPKSVAFPDPSVAIEVKGIRVLPVEAIVELKLASGLTNPGRLKDLADVQELIRTTELPLELQNRLDPMVREKYAELWRGLREAAPFES